MPAIVLRIKFTNFWRRIVDKEKVLDLLTPKLKSVDASILKERLQKIFIWEEDSEKMVQIVMARVLGTFALGNLGESTVLGIFESTYPDCIEFWICSRRPKNCIQGRKCVLENIPSIGNRIFKKYESDILLCEGGEEIQREGILSKYVRGNFNIGFCLAFVPVLITSLYNYLSGSDRQFNYLLPSIFLALWLIVLSGEILYNKEKGVYVVRE